MSTVLLSALLACSGGETPKPQPQPDPQPPPAPAFEPKHAALFGMVPDDFREHQGKLGKAKGKADEGKEGKGDKSKEGKGDKSKEGKGEKEKGKADRDDGDDAADKSDARIALGRMLFWDPRLSVNDEVSCNSCHKLMDYGVDGLATSPGHSKQNGARNSPTVWNAGGHFAQFWDGRAETLVEQAKGPILNPVEMGMANEAAVEKKIAGIDGYLDLFKAAFPGDEAPISFHNVAKAIASFEKGLATKGSAYDKYLGGQADALSAEQLEGYDLFVETGCASCHGGALFGGQMYQKLGLVEPWETKDLGRYEVTKADGDKYFFKVPSLRNVTKTGPYLHDGSMENLENVVEKMAKKELGKDLKPAEAKKIVAFLDSLTGEIPRDYAKRPDGIPGLPDPERGKAKAKAGDGEGKAKAGDGEGKGGKGKKGG